MENNLLAVAAFLTYLNRPENSFNRETIFAEIDKNLSFSTGQWLRRAFTAMPLQHNSLAVTLSQAIQALESTR